MMKFFGTIVILLSSILASSDLAGQHGWTVDPSDYEYDGEVNAIVLQGAAEITTGTVGAFVGSTCRGYADGKLFYTGKTIFSIRCYSNVASGETLTFKWFDPSNSTYHDIVETVPFVSNMMEGTAISPLSFHVFVCDPVSIATHPSGASMCDNAGSAGFSVSVNGTSPFVYQWQYYNGAAWTNVTNGSPAGAVYTGATTATMGVSGITSEGDYDYRCYITNCSGMSDATSNAATLTVNASPAKPSVTASGPVTFCAGGSVTLTSGTGTSYLWSNGATTQSINVTTSGSYTVSVTNTAGCQSPVSDPVTVTVNPIPAAPTITASGPVTFCAGGSVTLTSSAGSTYLWSTGATTQSINVSASGNYTVRITNAAGCQSPLSVTTTVTVNPLPGVNAGDDASIPNGTSTTLNGTVTGTGPFTYSWTPASLLVNASVEDPATVNLTSTTIFTFTARINATGCSNSDAVTVTITGGALKASPTATPGTICAGETIQLDAVATGGSGTYTYLWSSVPAGFSSTLAKPTATPAVSTIYNVAVYDGFSSVNAQVSVIVNPLPAKPVITATGPTTFCTGGNVTLLSSAGNSYLWSTGATTQSINVTTSGSYTVVVTNGNGCESPVSDAVTVTVNSLPAAPTITASGSTTFCSGGSVTLTSSAGSTYLWSTGATVQSINVSISGNYTVRVTNANGCQSPLSSPAVVTVNPLPVVSAGNDVSIPNGTSANLNGTVTGTGPFTYSWTPSSLLINPAVEDPKTTNLSSTTIFTFTATVNSTGCSDSDDVTVSVTGGALNASPSATPGIICSGESSRLDANAVGGSGTYTYLWSSVPAGFSSTLASPTTTPSVNTTYNVAVNDGFSTINRQVSVTVNPVPGVNAGNDVSIPNGTSTTLNGTVTGTGPFTYSWTPASLLVNAAVEDPVTVNLSSSTTFTFTANINSTGCSASDAVTVTITGGSLSVNPGATPGTICAGASVQLDARASGGSGNYTYSWTSVPAGFTSNIARPLVTPSSNTTYYITVNDGFSTVNGQVAVTVNALPATPTITASGPTTFCIGGTVTLTSSTATNYLWSTGATTRSINVIASGEYTVRVRNSNGCLSDESNPVTVIVRPLPQAPLIDSISHPTCTNPTGSVRLDGLPSTGIWTLTRYAGGITTSGTGTMTTVTGLASGIYNFTVRDESGCTSLVSQNASINSQPVTPAPPTIGTITHPTYTVPTGSVVLTGLPAGTWRLTRYPDGTTITGTGTSRTVSGLEPGTYTFTVTNAVGCTSASSASVLINARPGPPTVKITNPDTICSIETADLTRPEITAGSDANLKFSYWMDQDTTQRISNPAAVSAGIYYIKGSTTANFYTIVPVTVVADQMPIADAGPDQVLGYSFKTTMDANLPEPGTGIWSVESGTGNFADINYARSKVTELSIGRNEFTWTVRNGVCPSVSDKVIIQVNDLTVPSLITPNMDGNNDFFIIQGIENLGKTGLIIFDRRGVEVYKDQSYNNNWDGVDYDKNPLPDDTYFYLISTGIGRTMRGFVVIRR